MVLGITGSDTKNAALNLALGFGVATGCAAVSWAATKARDAYFSRYHKSASDDVKETYAYRTKIGSAILGTASAIAASVYSSKLGYGFILEPSITKTLVFAAMGFACGFVLDSYVVGKNGPDRFAPLGAGIAAAGYFSRFSSLAVLGIGLLGTAAGSGYIAIK